MQKAIFESSSNEVIKMTKLSGVLFTQWYHKNGNLKCCEKIILAKKREIFRKLAVLEKFPLIKIFLKKKKFDF